MKNLLFLISLSFSFFAFADSTQISEFTFNNQIQFKNINLSTEVTKTVYENRVVRSTCYRTEVRRQCQRVCDSNRQCRNICRDVHLRRPYSCYINQTVAVEIFDYQNISNINFTFDSAQNANEHFKVIQRGSQFNIDVASSGNYLIYLQKTNERIFRNGDVRYVDVDYVVTFKDVSLVTRVLKQDINSVSLKNNILSFKVGSGFSVDNFSLNLKLYRHRRIGSDILLFDEDIRNIAQIADNGISTFVKINLNNLNISLPSSKRVILEIDSGIDSSLAINANDIKLRANANWIYR